MRTISILLALLVGVLVAVIAIVNNEVVTVNYLLGQMDLTLFMLILGSALAGAIFMGLLCTFRSINRYLKSQGARDYKKVMEGRVKLLENEKKVLETELNKQQKERSQAAENEKKVLEAELNKQKELNQASEKAHADLENEKIKLEEELKKKQREDDGTIL